jgi:hypothetical protein
VWCSFGVLHLYRLKELGQHEGLAPGAHRFDRNAGLAIGLLAGATVAAFTGVGIDMVLYAVLVLLCQADLKIAIPSSVIIMAWTSLIGVAVKNLTHEVQPGVLKIRWSRHRSWCWGLRWGRSLWTRWDVPSPCFSSPSCAFPSLSGRCGMNVSFWDCRGWDGPSAGFYFSILGSSGCTGSAENLIVGGGNHGIGPGVQPENEL